MIEFANSLGYEFEKFVQTIFYVAAEMHAQGPASAIDQNLKVAAGLGGFDDAKRVFLFRYRDIGRVI